jgi:hypothetical protein
MTISEDYYAPTYRNAVRHAWHEFKEGCQHEYWDMSDPKGEYDDCRGWPKPLAFVLAPWRPLMWRFSRYNLERLLRPKKAERRMDHNNFEQAVFWGGGADIDDETWAYIDELVKEFGGEHMPPRDWQPANLVEEIGVNMGMTREEVRELVSK